MYCKCIGYLATTQALEGADPGGGGEGYRGDTGGGHLKQLPTIAIDADNVPTLPHDTLEDNGY